MRIVVLIAAFITTAFVCSLSFSEKIKLGSPGTVDFVQYWMAAQIVADGGNPFDPQQVAIEQSKLIEHDYVFLMRSPPWTLTILAPFWIIPFPQAAVFWIIANLFMLAFAAMIIKQNFPNAISPPLALGCAAVLFYPVWETVLLGQLSILLLLCVAVFVRALETGQEKIAGLSLIPLSVKPHLFLIFGIVLIAWSIRHKTASVILSFLFGFGGIVALTYIAAPQLFVQWVESLVSGSTAAGAVPVEHWRTTSLVGALRVLIFNISGNAPFWPIWILPATAMIASVIWTIIKPLPHSWLELAPPLLCISLMFAPYGWFYDQAILLIVQISLVVLALDKRTKNPTATILLLLLIQLATLTVAITGESSQHRFFWLPPALLGLWFWALRNRPISWTSRAANSG